jgi:cellulose biosynthesis protein BcsQ
MILTLDIFNKIIERLRNLRESGDILKFYIQLTQSNSIHVVIVSDEEIDKNRISSYDFKFTILTSSELEEDDYYSELFSNDSELVFYKNSRRKLTNLLNSESNYIPKTPIIGYYSYKGGMGRSTHLAITATHLARRHDKKIVILDCDFEAPGFSNFFLENPSAPRYQNGLVEYFFDTEIDTEINLDNYSWEVSKDFSKDGEIRIFPAGNLSIEDADNSYFDNHLMHYLEGLSRLDFSSKENIINKFKNLIEKIELQYQPDAIFIDSRTGFTDIFGIVGLKLASHVVGFFSNSAQNLPGIYQFIDSVKSIPEIKNEFRVLIVNSFSDKGFFEDEFKSKVNEFINMTSSDSLNDSLFTPDLYFFNYDLSISEIGTSREERRNWIDLLDNNGYNRGYGDVSERLNELIKEYKFGVLNIETNDNSSLLNIDKSGSKTSSINEINVISKGDIQKKILNTLDKNWPYLYGDSDLIDFGEEFEMKKFFYRDSMKDIFNFDKFLILGNKGTGKSYLFQALKNKDIVTTLKKIAQKSLLQIEFLHLVDKKTNYFVNTDGFESYPNEISNIGDFYSKFWKVYTWKSIISKINDINIDFESNISTNFTIENSTSNIKNIVNFISDIENIIKVEDELKELDRLLNSKEINLIVIYDNLDLMVSAIKMDRPNCTLDKFLELFKL